MSDAPRTPRLAWLLLPCGAACALALAVLASALWKAHTEPALDEAPLERAIAPVSSGVFPWNPLEDARDGDWCALVRAGRTRKLVVFRVKVDARTPADSVELVAEYWAPDAPRDQYSALVRRRAPLPIAAVFAGERPKTEVTMAEARSVPEPKRLGRRTFACARTEGTLVMDGLEHRVALWISPEVKSVGLVAVRAGLDSPRVEPADWELAGFGNGTIAAWGETIENLESRLGAKAQGR